MRRDVTAQLTVDVSRPSELAMSFAVADRGGGVEETLDVRLHAIRTEVGVLSIAYAATIEGREPPAPSTERDRLRYLRPSRYCESDELAATAIAEFGGLTGYALLEGVSSWVGTRLE